MIQKIYRTWLEISFTVGGASESFWYKEEVVKKIVCFFSLKSMKEDTKWEQKGNVLWENLYSELYDVFLDHKFSYAQEIIFIVLR